MSSTGVMYTAHYDVISNLQGRPAWHLPWLLQPDNPSVRLLTLRGLLGRPANDPEVREAQAAVMHSPPAQAILDKFCVPHYWDHLDDDTGTDGADVPSAPSAYTRVRAHSVWMLLLAALGANPAHPLVRQGCEFLFQTMQRNDGAFPSRHPVYGGVRTCTQGLTTEALLRLSPIECVRTPGFSRGIPAEAGRPPHTSRAEPETSPAAVRTPGFSRETPAEAGPPPHIADARTPGFSRGIPAEAGHPPHTSRAEPETGPALDPRLEQAIEFTAAMDYECPYNGNLPCAWGIVKLLRAMAAVPANQRNPAVSDVLETLDTLALLGCVPDRRLEAAVSLVVSKQGVDGRWRSELVSPRAQEVGVDQEGEPSKWVTLRALRVLEWWSTEGEATEGFPVLQPVVK
jgi:hypothetical protein